MTPKTKAFIQKALKIKRAPHGEAPKNFNYQAEIKNLQCVHSALEEALVRPIQIDTSMQDSLSIAELSSIPNSWEMITPEVQQQGHFVFEFSAFEHAFTNAFKIRNLKEHNGCEPLIPLEPLIEIVEQFGYVYLPPDELMELADGYNDPDEWGSRWYNQLFYYT